MVTIRAFGFLSEDDLALGFDDIGGLPMLEVFNPFCAVAMVLPSGLARFSCVLVRDSILTPSRQTGEIRVMEVIRGFDQIKASWPHVVVTIGNFDGVHLGHQRILALAVEEARSRGGVAVAFTFRPHPQIALHPEKELQLLSSYEEKLDLLAEAGIDITLEQPFSREFSITDPEQFFSEVLLKRLNAEAIVVGYDFGFGRGRGGHLQVLHDLCERAGVKLSIVQAQQRAGEVASSSRIRTHLLQGEVEKANQLLGREFAYRGVVVRGEGRGRVLGFPTANLRLERKLVLPWGVYATWAVLDDGRVFQSVTNVGVRPTFTVESLRDTEGGDRGFPALIETHILDQSMDLYGRMLQVRFVRRLREERKFSGVDSLKAQIANDIVDARQSLDG